MFNFANCDFKNNGYVNKSSIIWENYDLGIIYIKCFLAIIWIYDLSFHKSQLNLDFMTEK